MKSNKVNVTPPLVMFVMIRTSSVDLARSCIDNLVPEGF